MMRWKLIEMAKIKMFENTSGIMLRYIDKYDETFKSVLYFIVKTDLIYILPDYEFEAISVEMEDEEYLLYQTSINFLLWSFNIRVLYN